jgi:hypothetical protein
MAQVEQDWLVLLVGNPLYEPLRLEPLAEFVRFEEVEMEMPV